MPDRDETRRMQDREGEGRDAGQRTAKEGMQEREETRGDARQRRKKGRCNA